MHTVTILNYQGNKSSLVPFISESINKYISSGDVVCDIFSGSGSVGSSLKKNYRIIANDVELHSAIISSALLNTPTCETLQEAKKSFLMIFWKTFIT